MYQPLPIKRNDNFRSNYWEGYSPKLKRDVCYLGQLNYEYWLFLELYPTVISFCERPTTIKGIINNKLNTLTPNFWVKYADGTDSFVVITEKDNIRYQLVENWCQTNNYKFESITKEDIRRNQLIINNSQKLLPYLHRARPLDIDIHLVKKAITTDRKSIKIIIHELKNSISPQRIKEALYYLIFEKKIASDVYQKPLSLASEVWN